MSSTVNLTGTEYVSNIPAVYYSTTSSLVEKFASQEAGSIIAKTTLPGGTVISSTINLAKDPDNPGKVIASTVAASGITYVVSVAYGSAAIAATEVLIGSIAVTLGVVASPVVITLAAIGVVAIGTTILGNEIQSVIYDALASYEKFDFVSPEVTGYATKDQFVLQSAANDPDFCKRMFPEYIGYRQIVQMKSGTESFLYNTVIKKAEVTTVEPIETYELEAIQVVADSIDDVKHITINNRALDIRNLTPVELRNAVEHIDKVSFLLSNILIKVGEKLDMGSFGIYTVGTNSYDYSLSLIAKNHGMTTKELVMLNTWLVDDGRIDFLYPTKVLVDAGTIVNSVINHTIAGSMQDDVIIDHNGGTDTLIGNGGADYMDGGTGYDTYYSGNGDTIKDTDNNGRVLFEGFKLTGGVSETGCKPNGDGEYRGDGGVYKLSSGKLTFTKDGTNETLTIEKFVNGALGIILTSKDPGASCPPPIPNPEPDDLPTPSTPNPNFPSPLVLDLNGDGITSTFISSTSTYFDLDNDGIKQRTGWVQSDDALLALDKNQDGIINNASELFGNHTTLKNGTKAANGFEALKEYDENKDGVIDAKDNIYNTLSLWQDTDSDGVTDTGELHTLTELGVKSINLGYTQTTDYEEQNRIFQTSNFTTTDGSTQSINDVWFATESRDTARDTTVVLKDTVAALPDYRGAGRAENLSAAMNEIKIEREVA